jgi:hypothetical protein
MEMEAPISLGSRGRLLKFLKIKTRTFPGRQSPRLSWQLLRSERVAQSAPRHRKAQKGDGRHGRPLAGSGNFTNERGIMKKIFGLQRHKLLMGDRYESDIDVVGPYLCAVRRPGCNAR